MIGFLDGIVEEKFEGTVLVNVGGVGYEVCVSDFALHSLMIGESVRLYTYLQLREDGVSLFGFLTKDDKSLFLKLISVSGVGPKMASAIMSGMQLGDLESAIARGDAGLLSKIKGLGKKTAERIIVDLKDKVSSAPLLSEENLQEYLVDDTAIADATETLVSLGLNRNEANRLARLSAAGSSSAEEIIAKALRSLNR